MDAPVRFYFELVSPYSYLASLDIDAAVEATRRHVSWRPIDLPLVWQAQGVLDAYLAVRKVKAPYVLRDAMRCAARMSATMVRPKNPLPDTSLAKRTYWGLCEQGDPRAKSFLQAVWQRHFAQGDDIATIGGLAEAAAPLGLDIGTLEAAAALPQATVRQDASNNETIAAHCFGVPWFVVGDERFFDHDRIAHLVEYLAEKAQA